MNIIDSYARLPIGLYQDIRALQEGDTPYDDIDLRVKIMAMLTGQTERDVLNAPLAESSVWADAITFLERPAPEIGRIASSYRCGRFELVPTGDPRNITTAQYIDFQTFAPEGDARLVELLSVFLVPRGCKYNDGYDIAEVQAAIREDLYVTDALAVSAFFLTKLAALIRTSRSSLARMARKEKDPRKAARIRTELARLERLTETVLKASRPAGDGSPTSTTSAPPAAAPGTTSGK